MSILRFIFILAALPAFSLDQASSSIDAAQGLVIKKNRQEACTVLQKAIEANAANPKARAKLVDSLQQLSKLFFTDKGQKTFEAAQAAMWETPDLALSQLRSALISEDSNLQILENISRIQIFKQDCTGALASLKSARELNPFSGESAVLELRALQCQGNFGAMKEKAMALPALDKWQESFVQYLLAREAVQQLAWRKAFESLTKVTEEQPGFPEAHLLLAKSAVEIEKDPEPYLQKYVSLCKVITPRERKRFALEPRLCTGVKEAEDELAKKAKEI